MVSIARVIRVAAPSGPIGRMGRWPRAPAALWVPALAVGLLLALPLVYLVIRTAGAGDDAWALLLRWRTAMILLRTLALVVTVTVASVVIAVPVAWLTVRSNLPWPRFWSVVAALPLVIPSFVAGLVVQVALGPRGMLQQALEPLVGVTELPSIYGFPGAALTLTLLSYPYVLLPAQSSLRRQDPSLEDASRSLGHGRRATFRRVTLPLLGPAVAAGSLLVALYTLTDFGAVSLLRYETFTWAIFVQFESAFDRGLAAALSLALVALAAAILAVEALARGRARFHGVGPGVTAEPRRAHLGRWMLPALGFMAALGALALVGPMGVLVYWVGRGLAAGEAVIGVWEPLLNSVLVAALAALAAAVASLPVAALVVRYPSRFAWLIERATYTGFALPGIVVAISLVFFAVNLARPLYQTLLLLVLAYVVLFFPAMLAAVRTSLAQVRPNVEDAARTLGRSPIATLLHVTLPLIWPGIASGIGLVFLLTMKELPATLILGPIGFKTLATTTWSAASEAFFARAAMSALLIVLAAGVPLLLLRLRMGRAPRQAAPLPRL